MGHGNTFDPVWALMTVFTVLEVLVVGLLVMPVPSNKVRGLLHRGISKFWRRQGYVKKTSWMLLTLNGYYLYDALSNLWQYNKVYAANCENKLVLLYLQRNALISGGSVFLFFVMRRLLDIQGQLHATRTLAKQAAVQQQQLLVRRESTAGESVLERQHQQFQQTLTQLDKVVSDAEEEGSETHET